MCLISLTVGDVDPFHILLHSITSSYSSSSSTSVRILCGRFSNTEKSAWRPPVVFSVSVFPVIVMPSSHRQRRQDKTVSSRRRRRCELSWRQSQTVFSCPQWRLNSKLIVQSRLRWTHLWTSFDEVARYDVTIGNHVANWKLGQDKTRLKGCLHYDTCTPYMYLSLIHIWRCRRRG